MSLLRWFIKSSVQSNTTSMAGVVIRRLAGRSDLKRVAKLVQQEGWDLSLSTLIKFNDIGLSDWWVAESSDGRVIGSCNMVNHEDNRTCHAGMFIVDEKYRSQGIGGKLKSAVLAGVQEKNVLITALKPEHVLEPFKPLHEIHNLQLTKTNQKLPSLPRTEFRILPLADVPLELVEKYDGRTHPIKRTTLFHRCIIGDATCVFVAVESSSGNVIGYAALKETRKLWEFCPTYADTDDVGYELIRKMLDHVPEGGNIEVTPFAENQTAIDLYKEIGFSIQFTCMLMYSQKPPTIPVRKVYSAAGNDYSPM
ncbi:uncharacterized protein LOC124258365 [Haliotis rubra]|uniref:uncharacterized protein LOC124258365 n=1 Tax=Haliotis rubra TaxID=36100 RepID=UPI001EE5336E|nr:uncharacterized protein LOC124258365 [Haliotis rubra]